MSLLREQARRLSAGDDRAGTRRRDERVLHPGDPGSRPAAVLAGAGDPPGDHRRIRDVVRYLRLHLASAVRDNGTGRVVTTELSDTKIAAAKQTFADTGLDDVITVLEGDALSTLAEPGRTGRLRSARRLERAVSAGDRAARAASVTPEPWSSPTTPRRAGHEAVPRPRPQPRQRLCELSISRPGRATAWKSAAAQAVIRLAQRFLEPRRQPLALLPG